MVTKRKLTRSLVVALLVATALTGCLGGGGGAPGGDAGGGDGDGTESQQSGETWRAYAFDAQVETADGPAGTLQAFTFTHTRTEDGDTRAVAVDVTNEGTTTADIRTQRVDYRAGYSEPETVSSEVDVHRVDHQVTVTENTDDPHEENVTYTANVLLPTGDLEADKRNPWYFKGVHVSHPDGDAAWEYHLTEEMAQEMENGTVAYMPYTEGDGASAGFDVIGTVYGLTWFGPYVTGEEKLEEGSWEYDGASFTVEATTFEVSGHTFDGYRITQTADYGSGSSEEVTATVSPNLPVAYHFRYTSQGGSLDEVREYTLTSVTLE